MFDKRESKGKAVGTFGKSALCAIAIVALFSSAATAEPYSEGIEFYNQRNFQRAASCFETAIARSPENTNAIYYAALTYQQLRNNPRAIELYKQLATRYPGSRGGKLAIQALQGLGAGGGSGGGYSSSSASTTRSYSRSYGGSSSSSEDPDLARLPAQERLHFRTEDNGGKPVLWVSGSVRSTPLDFVFDTGADHTVIGMDHLAQIGLPRPSGPPDGHSMGVGNKVSESWIIRTDVKVGGIQRHNFPLWVSDRTGVPPLLGRNFMEPFNYTIDTSGGSILMTKKVTASSSGGFGVSSQGGVPFRRVRGGGVLVSVEVNGRPIDMLFDTGAQSCLFSKKDMRDLGISIPADAEHEMTQGVGGAMPGLKFPVSRMKLGPIDKTNLPITVVEQDFGEPLLGQSFFHDYQYTIDDQRNVIRFLRR